MLNTQKIYLGYVDAVAQLIDGTSLPSDALTQIRESISKAELLVPVIGAFSAGKSSLLNKFLQEDILAVGVTPETELATELRYSTDPHLLALRADGRSERIELAESTAIKSRAGEFSYLQLYLDNPNLQQFANLVLVDMPGFGSSLENHNKAIDHYLPRGTHFIVVTSVEEGSITRSMQRQLEELHIWGRSISYVLNKTNLRATEQVAEVADLVEAQIGQSVVCVGHDGHERVTEMLSAIDPEQVFQTLFLERLKDLTQSLFSQIGVALATLNKDQAQSEQARMELEKALHRLEEKRDELISQLRGHQLGRMVERCLNALEQALTSARDELVSAGLSGDRQGIARVASEIIRTTLTRVVTEEMRTLSHEVVTSLADTVAELGDMFGNFSEDPDWLETLTAQCHRGLEKTGEIFDSINNWAESVAEKNQNRKIYYGLTTILAVTTNVVAPLIELAIIFLPHILEYFQKDKKREQFQQKVMYEIIPAIKSKMRGELTAQLGTQMTQMADQINANFSQELDAKKRLIEDMQTNQQSENLEQRKAQLLEIKSRLQQLAGQTLYAEGCAA